MTKSTVSLSQAKSRNLFISAIFFSIFTNLLMLTGPLFMLQVYDRVLGSRSEETLVALFGLVAVLYFFFWLLEFARSRLMARVGARFQTALNEPVFRAVMERSANRATAVKGSLQDLETLRTFFASPVILALFDAPWTPVFLILIFIFHPLLGWLAIAGGSLLIVVALINQLVTARKSREGAELGNAAQQFARDAERGSDFVRAQGMREAMSTRWIEKQNAAVEKTLGATDWTGSFTSFTKAFRLLLQSTILAVGAYLVLQNQLTAGAMIAASILLGRALAPIELGIGQWPMVQRARVSWKSLKELLEAFPEDRALTELPPPSAQLDVTNVSLVIRRGDKPILNQISLSVSPGQALGIIGKSGSGKTTLARVLVGLVKPVAGDVRLAGATLDQYGAEKLGRYIGYLPQDVQLFPGTVGENVAQMETNPNAEKVVAAAKKARVHEIILKLPDGYDTLIGVADAQLSGGQKQRLALARALYNDPVLLVLDEPNSALDAEGSEALNAVVNTMKAEGKAVLIMTHRPTAISTCDNLLVVDQGKVAAYGPRDEIIKSMMKNAGDVQRAVGGGTP
jgi:PrtD family type I secretion system ABC transporter